MKQPPPPPPPLVKGGGGFSIIKLNTFDVPPPGGSLTTVTLAIPTVAISAAVMAA
jgi:hypothetical protein